MIFRSLEAMDLDSLHGGSRRCKRNVIERVVQLLQQNFVANLGFRTKTNPRKQTVQKCAGVISENIYTNELSPTTNSHCAIARGDDATAERLFAVGLLRCRCIVIIVAKIFARHNCRLLRFEPIHLGLLGQRVLLGRA
jgi:hypothetical protein